MDGRLSLEEFIEVRYSDGWTLDKNMNGRLSLDEFIEVRYSDGWTRIEFIDRKMDKIGQVG